MPHVCEVLIEEAVSQTPSGVGEKCFNLSSFDGSVKLVNAFCGGKVGFHGLGFDTEAAKRLCRFVEILNLSFRSRFSNPNNYFQLLAERIISR